MGRRNAEEEANHWPGFVDALSTIVMVVTFLLIILAIVIFALSQMVAQEMISAQSEQRSPDATTQVKSIEESVTKLEEKVSDDTTVVEFTTESKKPVETSNDVSMPKIVKQTEVASKPQQISSEATTQVKNSEEAILKTEETESQVDTAQETSAEDITRSEFVPELADILKAQDKVELEKDLSILSQESDDDREIVVSAFEKQPDDAKVEVQTSSQLLRLKFDENSSTIDDKAITDMNKFINDLGVITPDQKITIWSFTGVNFSSVSEAKRIAYYRVLMARNELIKSGFSPSNVQTEIRFGSSPDNENSVQLIIK